MTTPSFSRAAFDEIASLHARLAAIRQAVLSIAQCATPTERSGRALWLLQQVKEGML